MSSPGIANARPAAFRHPWLRAALRLTVLGLVLGWAYGWAGPHLYAEGRRHGFAWGMAHGACMPMALPALLLGREASIYSDSNTGRGYKLGYIAGINLCGLVFFGGAFGSPRRPPPPQNHQLR